MKNVIIILGSLLLFSCNNDQVILTQEEYKQLKNEPLPEYPKPFELYDGDLNYGQAGIVLGSDNHEFLETDHGRHSESVSHYVDCKLCKPLKNTEDGSKNKKIKY